MTTGTATVARTKVRSTVPRGLSHGPIVRLRTTRVGTTATQIIRASWWTVGGPTGVGRAASWWGFGVVVIGGLLSVDGGVRVGPGVDGVAGRPDSRDGGAPGGVDGGPAGPVGGAAEVGEQRVVGDEPRPDEDRFARDGAAAADLDVG